LSGETVAEVVVSGNIVATSARKTLTRTVSMGIFATQKKGKIEDRRQIVFQAADQSLDWGLTLTGPPTAEVAARKFVQSLGLAVARLEPATEAMPARADHQPAIVGTADELAKLAKLFE